MGLGELGWVLFQGMLQQQMYQAEMAKSPSKTVAVVKPMFPFGHRDIVGEDGTNMLLLADIGSGKTNTVGHIVEMFVPLQQRGELNIAVIDQKGEMLERLPPGITEMFDSRRYMGAWPIVEYDTGLDPEEIADDFLDDLASGWREKETTARLDRHVHYAMMAAAEFKIPVERVVKIVEGLRLPTKNADLRDYWRQMDDEDITPAYQRAKIIESSQNRLSPFSQNSLMRRLCNHEHHWSLYDALKKSSYLYMSLPVGKPLSEKRSRFLMLTFLQSLIRAKERLGNSVAPLLLVIDEGQEILPHDIGFIRRCLNSKRGQIHVIVVCHTLTNIANDNPEMLQSLIQNCQIKMVGRGQNIDEYRLLARIMYASEWNSNLGRGQVKRTNAEGEEELTDRQLMELDVFCFERAKEMSEQKPGYFTVKVKEKPTEKFYFPLREKAEIWL
jgi:hypothetical protein